jgi:endonuclease YncB( thermonuclease family)
MARAFIQNGVWRARPAAALDVQTQRQATLRVSIAAAVATLAFAALHDGGAVEPTPQPARSIMTTMPEIITAKADDRVPAIPALPNPYRRRAPPPDVAETPAAAPESTATARPVTPTREAAVADAGMIRTGDATYRLAGIALPDTSSMCRRLDGLAVPCLDRAQSYLQLLVRNRAVTCARAPQQSDGPLEAHCRIGDTDIAEQMVRQGWARAGDQPEERFMLAEIAAKKQKLGIWRE